jgi:hypothetical protein
MELYFQAKISSQTVSLILLFLSRAKFPLVGGKTFPRKASLVLYPASPILMHHYYMDNGTAKMAIQLSECVLS